jgi:large conductance mechanosensitive channel
VQGFKNFVMRGNLIELAVAFVMAASFATVVTALVQVVLELLAKAGGAPSFDEFQPGGLTTVGPFLTALVAFFILAAVVYFLMVKPYEAAKARYGKEEADEEPSQDVLLLTEIRDLLARQNGPV